LNLAGNIKKKKNHLDNSACVFHINHKHTTWSSRP